MDIEKLAEKLKELIVGELKEEFRDFKATVSGELAGFRLAIESMNQRLSALEERQSSLEAELRDIRRSIEYTSKGRMTIRWSTSSEITLALPSFHAQT